VRIHRSLGLDVGDGEQAGRASADFSPID
jgi:hypothetical protein